MIFLRCTFSTGYRKNEGTATPAVHPPGMCTGGKQELTFSEGAKGSSNNAPGNV